LADLASAPAEMHACWACGVLDGTHRGVNPRYLAAGVHIARDYAPDSTLSRVLDAPDFDDDTLARLEHLLPDDWGGHELVSLWETCAVVPGFSSYLKHVVWDRLTAEQRRCFLRFFMAMRWDQDGPMAPDRWCAIAPQIPRLERQLQDVPASFTDQYLSDLGSVLSGTRAPSKVAERLPLAIDHLARINRPPFNPDGNIEDSVANLLALPELLRRHVLAAPTEVWLVLDKACRRSNAAALIAWGLSSLVAGLPQLVHEAFGAATGTLIRVARQLGVLSWAARKQLLSRCAGEAIFGASVEGLGLGEIVALIDETEVPEAAAIVPRAVRDHLAGRRPLSPGQVDRDLRHIRAALPTCRLAVVRAAVDEQLARSVGAPKANREALDALAMLQEAYKNKRGLRKFLRAYLSGDTDHLLRHPVTRGWLRRHSRINVDLWTGGFERRISAADGTDVVIRIEQDPLEVLKMGTYVGSCLSLGGGHAYSAAAVLLDINKQVLYARDQRGAVIARQLLAISKDDRLVAYTVYPESTPAWLQLAFDAFDTEFAAMLGIKRAAPGEEYYVEDVLSHDWWDDGIWDPRALRPRHSRVG
jgi:hypothetical protein